MSQLLESWAAAMTADGLSRNTIRARLQVVRSIAEEADTAPADLRSYHVRTYLERHSLRPWSRLAYLQHLRAWARYTGGPDPTEGLRKPPTPRLLPDPLPEDELRRLLQHLVDEVERAWVLLGAYAGLRAFETAKLRGDEVVADQLRVEGKGGRWDVLPIAPVLQSALSPYAGLRAACWPGTAPWKVSHRIAVRAAEIGIHMRYHRLRHRFGTAVYRETRDLLLTQRLMRHDKPQTTAGYALVVDDDGRQAVHNIPGATPDIPP